MYLPIALAALSAIEQLTKLFQQSRKAAAQNSELTPEQEAQLDERAAAVFASPAADPNANE